MTYADGVLRYRMSEKDHRKHLHYFLKIRHHHKLLEKLWKCQIGQSEENFLGYSIYKEGVTTEEGLVKAVEEWQRQRSVRGVQKCLELDGFYRKVLAGYDDIAQPISDVVRQRYCGKGCGPTGDERINGAACYF